MEAPERNKPLLLCQKCFAIIPDGEEFCAECGAPVVDDLSEGSDSAVYPELARANLLRMRGEYKVAEDICLAILRRHPNSATANTLLGDICAEKGDLKQAASWYELALDILPDSESDRRKLEWIRQRIHEHEAAETAKHLGLPESRPKVGLWVGGLVVFILLVAGLAYLLGERMNSRKLSASNQTVAPVEIPLESSRASTPGADGSTDPAATNPPTDLLGILRSAFGTESGRLVGANRFPESLGVLLTLTATGTEEPRRIAAQLGRAAIERAADAPFVTVVVMREGTVAYVGTITRESFQATANEQWRAQNGDDPIAFANAAISNEWPPAAPPPVQPETGTENPPDAGTAPP